MPDRYRLDQSDPPQTNAASTSRDSATGSLERHEIGIESDRPHGSGTSTRSTGETTTAVNSSERVGVEDREKVIVVDWYGDDDPENPQNW